MSASSSLGNLSIESTCALLLSACCAVVACTEVRSPTALAAPAGVVVAENRPDAGSPAEPASGADAGVGAAGGAGTAADEGAAGSEVASALEAIPTLLSQTGLFEGDMQTLAAGVRPYEPRFSLWSDGADKRRWVFLPEGAQIDTSSMEYWSYPAGTRLYKEFSVNGVRVETRLLHRQANGAWWMMSYQWREDQSDADAVPNGVVNASGTEHDIPSTEDCRTCHLRMPDKALGFSAIQLSQEVEPVDPTQWSLSRLQAEGKLTQAPPEIQLFPENQLAREVLGYLHANCGHCHQPRSSVSSRVSLSLWLRTDALSSVQETPTYLSTVGQKVSLSLLGPQGDVPLIIAPGSPEGSALFVRASSRGEAYSMPPLSTKQADPIITEFMRQWIESLADAPQDDGSEGDGSEGDGAEDDGSEGDGAEDDGSGDDGAEDDGSGDDSSGDDSADDGSEDDGSEDDGSEGDDEGAEDDGSETEAGEDQP